MTTSKRSDDQLIDLLDEALRDFKQDALVNSSAWRMSHPELGEEGFGLLETLTALSSSIDIVGSPTAEELSSFAEQNDATWIGDAYPGKKIARYDVLAHVGAGAMGNVFKAHDPKLDRVVAIKMPHWENLSREPEIAKERFLREARAAAGVRHAHVCPIYDAGESDGQPFVVMAFIDGEPLDAILKRGLMEDSRRAVRIVAEVAEGLGEVHRFGIIHRDLKPGNILIDRSGRANLTDFGLALSTVQTDRLTNDGMFPGLRSR